MVSTRPLLRMRSPISGRPTRNLLVVFGCIAYALACVGVLFLRPISTEDLDQPLHAMLHSSASAAPPAGRAGNEDDHRGWNRVASEPTEARRPILAPPPTIDQPSLIRAEEAGGLCLTRSQLQSPYGCSIPVFAPCDKASPAQVWIFESNGALRFPDTDECLDVFHTDDGAHVCPCHGEPNQLFSVNDGRITARAGARKCITNVGGRAVPVDCALVDKALSFVPASWYARPTRPPITGAFKPLGKYAGVGSEGVRGADGAVSYADKETLEHVRGMMKHSWDNYVKFAWGADELRPLSRTRRNWLGTGLAATIVDSLDTLHIMGMHDEFEAAAKFVREELSFDVNSPVSFFETVIRDLGGLLSAYAMSNDARLLEVADELGKRLLPAFNTATRLPNAVINLHTGQSSLQPWNPNSFILAEVGTVQLEFKALAYYTGNVEYATKAMDALDYVFKLDLPDRGMYPVFLGTAPGPRSYPSLEYTLGGLSDSFYEYLIKQWVWSNRTEPVLLEKYLESVEGIQRFLVNEDQVEGGRVRYVGKYRTGNARERKMEHLACFAPGMLALGAHLHRDDTYEQIIALADDLVTACRLSYVHQPSGVGPEKFFFQNGRAVPDTNSQHYILRPEYVESLFYLWRITKNVKYREWGYDVINALDSSCRLESGYSGLNDVRHPGTGFTDVQESFFLAETLKYLYLLFADDSLLPLDQWVFNTEAHPLPVVPRSPLPYPHVRT